MKKTILCQILILLAVMLLLLPSASYGLAPDDLLSDAAILIDRNTGQILFEKNAYTRMYPASTTKIMTALLVIENLDLSESVTVGDEPPLMEGSSISLDFGEVLTVEQLLYGLLVTSGNDCAAALAIYMSGTQEEFAARMTERAHQLGAYSTSFANPHGLHDPSHFTTAYDLAIIANAAMNNETFRRIVSTTRYEIPPTNRQPETRYLNNTNALWPGQEGSDTEILIDGEPDIIAYEYVTGIKTGFTDEAGRCLVSSARHDGREVISVVMHGQMPGFYQDSKRLLIYGLEEMTTHSLYESGQILKEIELNNPGRTKVMLIPDRPVSLLLPKESSPGDIRVDIREIGTPELPITANEPIAEMVLSYGGQ
ncbi:MAG: D-alanyl-D-alanine carboxypeptidase family protein, partial [Bacillota bacterium]|nr:D-alanyl-D-alanine carboxypeptidase family protein [Bacillota bacterium]